MEEYPWAYGTYTCLKSETCAGLDARIMIGLTSLMVVSDSHNMKNSIEWSDPDCEAKLSTLGAGDYCSICRNASLGCAAVALLSIVTGFINLYTDIQRMRARNDHNFAKNLALASNVIGALQQLFAVSIFHGLCVREFPLQDEASNFTLELEMGSGGALLASACFLNMFGIVIHFIIPVPQARWRTYGDITEEDPAPGEWPSLQEGETAKFTGAIPGGDTVSGHGPGWNDGNMIMVKSSKSFRDEDPSKDLAVDDVEEDTPEEGPKPAASRGRASISWPAVAQQFRIQVPPPYPGVQLRKSMDMNDKMPNFLQDGKIVNGWMDASGVWVKLGPACFLPVYVGNMQVAYEIDPSMMRSASSVSGIPGIAGGGQSSGLLQGSASSMSLGVKNSSAANNGGD